MKNSISTSKYLLFVVALLFFTSSSAQMEIDGQILYGNEWIDYDNSYVKISVAEDGIYRVSRNELSENGIPVDQIGFDQLYMYHMGKSISFYIGPNDEFIEFYGVRNRGELDRFIYFDDASILNPEYSIVSDEAVYFITWKNETNSNFVEEIITDLTNNNLEPIGSYRHQELVNLNFAHYKPTQDNFQVRYSNFVGSEGFGSAIRVTNSINVPISNIVNDGSKVDVKIRYGGNNRFHQTAVRINGFTMETFNSISNEVVERDFEVDFDLVGTSNVEVKLEGSSSDDKNIISIAKVTYPRLFDVNSDSTFVFHLEPSSSTRYIEIDGYDIQDTPIVYDLIDRKRIVTSTTVDGKIGLFLSPSDDEKVLYLYSPSKGLKSISSISQRDFINYNIPEANYIIISNEELRNQDNIDWVQEYGDYRASELGGNYEVIIVNVGQLYDQFAYGVDRHFISLRNFGYWTKANFENPAFMFIIGKGREYNEIRTSVQKEENPDVYVPTWGVPGSDNMILATDSIPIPIYSVGRLAAKNSDEIRDYLDKVKQHDQNMFNPQTIEDRLWQKKVVHLSGGTTDIQASIFNNLKIMADTIENNMYGADVQTHQKMSVDVISEATSDQIFNQINAGLSLITFFGHASVGSFDFNLDNVENYENEGKYPMLISLGCYSGNIHSNNPDAISENFILEKNKGAIVFLAASGTAYIGVQNRFGKQLYSNIGGEYYGKPIGQAVDDVKVKLKNFSDYSYVTFFQQLSLHGDPAVRLPSFETPDFVPDGSTIKTEPKFIDTYEEEFEVCFDVANIGKAIPDSFAIQVRHQNPEGEIEYEIVQDFISPFHRENYCFTIPITSRELVGRNRILVHVDHKDNFEEIPNPVAESNNHLRDQNGIEGFEFFILNNSAVPTHPDEFAIVTTSDVSLIANTFNAFGEEQTFFIELDTTMLFDSPLLEQNSVSNIKGQLRWNLTKPLINSTVYYWRVGSENKANGEIAWRESSFIYEPGQREGWNQSHYFQFLRDDFTNLEYDTLRNLKFVDNVKEIRMNNGPLTRFWINSNLWSKWKRNIDFGVAVVLFDPIIGNSIRNYGGDPQFGSINTNVPEGSFTYYFEFPTNTLEQRENIINVLKDSIPEGYVVAVNFVENGNHDYNLEEWEADSTALGTSILKVLENEGALRLEELKANGSVPYIFAYQKGKNKVFSEEVATEEGEQISSLFQIKSLWDKGDISSTLIGPSSSWDELIWDAEISGFDSVIMNVTGIRIDGNEEVLFDSILSKNTDLSSIDANEFPLLRLNFYTSDKALSAAQLKQLRVYYDGITDLALNPDGHFAFHASKLDEGDDLRIEIDISNSTNRDASPTTILYSIIDEENNQTDYSQDIQGIAKGSSQRNIFSVDTKGMKGVNTLQVLLNPSKNPMEKYYFNNLGLTDFEIIPDTVNPLLFVTFDGVQIMNEDIVSAKPLIRMELDDKNPFLLLNEPDNFTFSLKAEDGEITQILLDDPQINFIPPSSSEDNSAVIEYSPSLEDGRYLLSVQGRDASGNLSGSLKYEVNFRVYNEEMVSNVFNYPNPFSTSTQFIFTLTGDEEPGNVLIRIMTLSGKVVREITGPELGNLRVGMNQTDVKWDGTDDFGEKLGNGTYLYQVITKKLDGSDYDHFSDPRQNNTDYLFKEGFGKLVIIR